MNSTSKINIITRRSIILNVNWLPKTILKIISEYDSLYGIISKKLFIKAPLISSICFNKDLSLLKFDKELELITWSGFSNYDIIQENHKLPSLNYNIDNIDQHITLPDGSILFIFCQNHRYQCYLCLWDIISNTYDIILSTKNKMDNINFTIDNIGKLKILVYFNYNTIILEKHDTIWKENCSVNKSLYKINNTYFLTNCITTFSQFIKTKKLDFYIWNIITNAKWKIKLQISNLIFNIIKNYYNESTNSSTSVLEDKNEDQNEEDEGDDEGDDEDEGDDDDDEGDDEDDEGDDEDEGDERYQVNNYFEQWISEKDNNLYIMIRFSNLKEKVIILLFKLNLSELNSLELNLLDLQFYMGLESYKCIELNYENCLNNKILKFYPISDHYILILTDKGLFQFEYFEEIEILKEISLIPVSKEYIDTSNQRTKFYLINNNQLIFTLAGSYCKILLIE